MQTIKLNKQVWEIDTSHSLGSPGGFGEVFQGSGKNDDVAIKRLKVTASQAAHRELQIGKSLSERQFKNIVPIIDYGQDADSDRYFLVMPICERSLQDDINNRGVLPARESIEILLAILSGRLEVQDITHRDLKPSNVLLHESVWKIADFGIAKFVEDSTSLETLRSSLTPAYAAPEQWQLQRPTGATDIYATGCIAHALVTGKPPFSGDVDALREQHLNNIPQPLDELPANARSMVSQMLRKNAEIRPKLERCIEVFQEALENDDKDIRDVDAKMAEAVNELAIMHAKREVEYQAREKRKRKRESIYKEAAHELNQIKDRLFHEIKSHAQDVMERSSSDTRLSIGNAVLTFDTTTDPNNLRGIKKSDPEEMGWGVHKRQSSWDLIAITSISIEQRVSREVYKRCANIVFGKPNENSEYRWYEMAFWSLSSKGRQDYPFCLDYVWEIDKALSEVMDKTNLAHNPRAINGEDEDSFIEYWMDIVTQAMVGKLARPSTMPMKR